MKLLMYVHDWAPTVGGVQTVTQTLARGLAASSDPKIDLTLVTMTPVNGMDDSIQPFRIVRQPGFWSLLQLIREADVVHLAGPALLPMALAALLQKPRVIEHHGFQGVCPNGNLFFNPDHSACPGHFMAGRYEKCFECNAGEGKLRSLRMTLLTFLRRDLSKHATHNVVPTQYLGKRLVLPRQLTILHGLTLLPQNSTQRDDDRPFTVIFLGRLVSAKNPAILLDAVDHLKNRGHSARLIIVGDGPERQKLETDARKLGVTDVVKFAGGVSDEELERIWGQCDVLVLPSLGGEVFGLVVAEAMFRGHPAVVPENSALAEVAGDAGLTFCPTDAEALAACVSRLLCDPALRKRLQTAAMSRANLLFTADTMVNSHLALYRSMVRSD